MRSRRLTLAIAAVAVFGLLAAGVATTAGAAGNKNQIRIVGGLVAGHAVLTGNGLRGGEQRGFVGRSVAHNSAAVIPPRDPLLLSLLIVRVAERGRQGAPRRDVPSGVALANRQHVECCLSAKEPPYPVAERRL
jgi:hypothetical protein